MENKKGAVSSCFEGAGKCTCCFSLRLNSSIARDDKSRRGDWGWFSPNYSSMPSLEQEWICFPKLRKEKTAQSLRWVMFSIERPGWNMEELWAGWLLAERTVYGGRYLGHGRRVNKYLMYPSEPQERIGHFSFPQWGFEKLELQDICYKCTSSRERHPLSFCPILWGICLAQFYTGLTTAKQLLITLTQPT